MPKTSQRREATTTRTFLFSDLREYTSYVETHGDAAAARLLRDYRTLVRREVARHKGAEIKTEGDSFYVVFVSASSGLDCAVAILRKVKARNDRDPEHPLQVGIGLHVGEAIAYDDQFVGSAVNVGSRLAGAASANELILSDTLRGLIRTGNAYPMTELGALRLKGVSEPIRAWSVRWQSETTAPPALSSALAQAAIPPRAAPGQLVCPVLVGREDELGRFAMHLDAAARGDGQAVLLSGEAGVGKSALVREAQVKAHERKFRVLLGVTTEYDTALPYAPFLSAVRSGFRGLEADRLGRVLSQAAPDLAQLFPELGRVTEERGSVIEQHRLAVAFQHLFTTFARENPIFIVIEDLHWADEASLALLHYLARELRDHRIFLLATYRSDEMHRRHPLLRVVTSLERERLVSKIHLAPLSSEETRAVLFATLAAQNARDLTISDAFRDAIYERSEGNPFFTEELLRSLVESGDLAQTEERGWHRTKPLEKLRIPASVREAVQPRLDAFSEDARLTLSVAAVIGPRVDFELLRAVRDIKDIELEAHLRELAQQQLIVEADDSADIYGFRHALTREVIYEDLMVRERKRLHRAVAAALPTDAEPALRAHHFLASGDLHEAVPHLLEAARRALLAGASREAARGLERAVEIGLTEEQLPVVLESLAETYHRFERSRAIKAAEDALALFRERGDARGASRMLRLASRSSWLAGKPGRARELAREAIDELKGAETVELARAKANLAHLMVTAVRTGAAVADVRALADEALAIGERLGDPWTVANAVITRAIPDIDIAGLRRGLDVASRHGFAEVAVRAYINLVQLQPRADDRWRAFEEGIAYARRHGIEEPILVMSGSWTAFTRGDWDAVVELDATVPQDSAAYRGVLAQSAFMKHARGGPQAAVPTLAEVAGMFGAEGDGRAESTYLLFSSVLKRDRAAAAAQVIALRSHLNDAKSTRTLTEPWVLLLAAMLLNEPEIVDFVDAAERKTPEPYGYVALAIAATRSVLARDAAGCARSLLGLTDIQTSFGELVEPHVVVPWAQETKARVGSLGPEWEILFKQARASAEKTASSYWLGELDALEGASR